MGNFERFYGMDSKFVYYNDLARTHPEIFRSLQLGKMSFSQEYADRLLEISLNFKMWANNEAKRESRLLSKMFNVNIDFNLGHYNMQTGKQIIEALNSTLGLKAAYDRHVKRITGVNGSLGESKIDAPQFFADYFKQEFYKIASANFSALSSSFANMTLSEIGDALFSMDSINKALEATFFDRLKNSGDWSANDSNKGYYELFSLIENFNKDDLLQQVKEAYKLDQLKENLMKDLHSKEELIELLSSKGKGESYIKTSLKESTTAKGTLAEILTSIVAVATVNAMQDAGGDSIAFHSSVVGKSLGKADVFMTFNVDPSPFLEVIERQYKNRADRVKAYKALNEKLRYINDGFIVYTNAKDYTLVRNKMSNGYTFGGFSAGKAISLSSLEGVISNTPGGSSELIGQIMNTMEGAVYSDKKGEIEKILSEKMAYLLFDDVLTLGKDSQSSDPVIHLLMLDGIYFPMSFMYYLMGEAISSVGAGFSFTADEIFKVTISSGSIAFPDGPWGPGQWTLQKQIAYSQIQIKATFLKSFVDVIRAIM